mmetsp:Transcript_10634/g.12246  ORF Transcript_10634/g.12246 Transcript_10634/m.12246 type:complete len:82 (+) Transcript_10634:53-298(+)
MVAINFIGTGPNNTQISMKAKNVADLIGKLPCTQNILRDELQCWVNVPTATKKTLWTEIDSNDPKHFDLLRDNGFFCEHYH